MDYIISSNGLIYNHKKSDNPNEKEFAAHTHNKYEILYFISGEVDCVIGTMRHAMKPGEIILIPSLYAHYIDIIGTCPYERIVLNFDHSEAGKEIIEQVFSAPRIIDTDNHPMLSGAFERFNHYSKIFPDNERQILFYNILTELLYLIHNALKSEGAASPFDGHGKAFKKAIDYINDHILDSMDINSICQDLLISHTYIHKIFNNNLGMSPMKYIKTRRLLYAREMIRLGEKPTNVAKKACFNDYTSFFRAYKKYFGYTPADTENI